MKIAKKCKILPQDIQIKMISTDEQEFNRYERGSGNMLEGIFLFSKESNIQTGLPIIEDNIKSYSSANFILTKF